MKLDALNKYLEATQHHLGVEEERYGGGFRAIVAHRSDTEFLFCMLEGDDLEATEAQSFLWENPLFPSASGGTLQDALKKLNAKLDLLYEFEPIMGSYKWLARRRFELKAQFDADVDEEPGWYDVPWSGIVQDLQSGSSYYYENSKAHCGPSEKRDLHALRSFKYEGEFSRLSELT